MSIAQALSEDVEWVVVVLVVIVFAAVVVVDVDGLLVGGGIWLVAALICGCIRAGSDKRGVWVILIELLSSLLSLLLGEVE